MNRYTLPKNMRYSTLSEREFFYREEFNLAKVRKWLKRSGRAERLVFGAVIGRHTKIFPEKYKDDVSTMILFDEHQDIEEVKVMLLDFLPESVYYDRTFYDQKGKTVGQEIAFDLDPENLTCPIHGTLEEKMGQGQGLAFCDLELRMVRDETLRLYEELSKIFSQLKIVYSGRGFHIHVVDPESFGWSIKQRKQLALSILSKGFPIDEWVTSGGMRWIRLPFSLHGMVSRVVLPLTVRELRGFDPTVDPRCMPSFLRI